MYQKVEDINQKENAQTASIQSVEFRLRKVEDVAEQILNHIAVVHRFMATHTRTSGLSDLPEVNLAVDRLRKSSERSDDAKAAAAAATDAAMSERLLSVQQRRRPTRSLTEVRPPDNLFLSSEGLHFETRSHDPVTEEQEVDEEEEEEEEEVDNAGGDGGADKQSYSARRCVFIKFLNINS